MVAHDEQLAYIVLIPLNHVYHYAASIYFKNAVKRYWYENESTPAHLKIAEADKDTIKANILQLLASTPTIVR